MARSKNEANLKEQALNRYQELITKRSDIEDELKGLQLYLVAGGKSGHKEGAEGKGGAGRGRRFINGSVRNKEDFQQGKSEPPNLRRRYQHPFYPFRDWEIREGNFDRRDYEGDRPQQANREWRSQQDEEDGKVKTARRGVYVLG